MSLTQAQFRDLFAISQSGAPNSVEAFNTLVQHHETMLFGIQELMLQELPPKQLQVIPHMMLRLFSFWRAESIGCEFWNQVVAGLVELLRNPTPVVYQHVQILGDILSTLEYLVSVSWEPVFECAKAHLEKGTKEDVVYAIPLLLWTTDSIRRRVKNEQPVAFEAQFETFWSAFENHVTVETVLNGEALEILQVLVNGFSGVMKAWWRKSLEMGVLQKLIELMLNVIGMVAELCKSGRALPGDPERVRASVSLLLQLVYYCLEVGQPGYEHHSFLIELRRQEWFCKFYCRILELIPYCMKAFATDIHFGVAFHMMWYIARDFRPMLSLGLFSQPPMIAKLLEVLYWSVELPPSAITDFTDNPDVFYESAYMPSGDLRSIASKLFKGLPFEWFPMIVDMLKQCQHTEARIWLTACLCSHAKTWEDITQEQRSCLEALFQEAANGGCTSPVPEITQFSLLLLVADAMWLRPEQYAPAAIDLVNSKNLLSCDVDPEAPEFDSRKFSVGCRLWREATRLGIAMPGDVFKCIVDRRSFCITSDIWEIIGSEAVRCCANEQQLSELVSICFAYLLEMQEDGELQLLNGKKIEACYRCIEQIYTRVGAVVNAEQFLAFWHSLQKTDVDGSFFEFAIRLCRHHIKNLWPFIQTFPAFHDSIEESLDSDWKKEDMMLIVIMYMSECPSDSRPPPDFLVYYLAKFKSTWENVPEECDLYLLCELVSIMMQQQWLPESEIPDIVTVGCKLLTQANPEEAPTQALATFDLLMSAHVFYNANVPHEHLLPVWERLVASNGLVAKRDMMLHSAYFRKLNNEAGSRALAAIASLEAQGVAEPNPDLCEHVTSRDEFIPAKLSELVKL